MKGFIIICCLTLLGCQANSQLKGWAQWTKHPDNPVYSSADSRIAAGDPTIIREGNTYYMYYTDIGEQDNTIIALATSDDGVKWTYQGRILEGKTGSWDEAQESAAIWRKVGKSYLFYSGYRRHGEIADGFPADVGLAVSSNPTEGFTSVSSEPVFTRSLGWYDSDATYSIDIIKVKEVYYMIYVGHCYVECDPKGAAILGATSTDLRHWVKHDTPVLTANPELPWMAGFVAEPAILAAPKGKYYLFFTAFADWEDTPPVIGIAESHTPFGPWEINPEPILVGTQDWEVAWTGAPDVLLENDVVKVWYLGVDARGYLKIGYATAPWPLRQ